jgi:hypothetical protein
VSLTGYLYATQAKAGAAVNVTYRVVATTPDDQNYNGVGIGTTTTSTPPATIGDLTHKDAVSWNNALGGAGLMTEVFSGKSTADGSGFSKWSDRVSYDTFAKTLDSNYAAGKYLWAFMTADDFTLSGTTLQAVSRPYHIR